MICDKITYKSHGEASRQIPHMNSGKRKKHKYSVYKCDHCGGFHITTADKGKPQPRKKSKYKFRYEKRHLDIVHIKQKKNGRK